MAPERGGTEAALARLRELFVGRLGEALANMSSLAELLDADGGNQTALAELERELHRLRGTAGTFGFTEAARLAGEMEDTVAAWRVDPSNPAHGAIARSVRLFIHEFDRKVRTA